VVDGLSAAVQKADTGAGVIIFTDMFGGTPTNISCTFLEKHVEVVTGINLPALVRAINMREGAEPLAKVAAESAEYGQRHISVAGQLLRKTKEKAENP